MAQVIVRPYKTSDHEAVQDIFWETTSRTQFASINERVEFQQKYLDSYFSELALVAELDGSVVGYIVASATTKNIGAYWSDHLSIFDDLYQRYPAHLHINCAEEARGHGIGSQLVERLEIDLIGLGVGGLHLITLSGARNVSFYQKLGFNHKVERLWNGKPLLFLGKTL
ncbi:MAG: GNAT family N-acetyltransferase [Bacteriovoracia bacterium]